MKEEKLSPKQIVEEMQLARNSKCSLFGSGCEWLDVAYFGEYGRTETLVINNPFGYIMIQANGESKDVTLAESFEWYRKNLLADWYKSLGPGDGYTLWLGMAAGCLDTRFGKKAA